MLTLIKVGERYVGRERAGRYTLVGRDDAALWDVAVARRLMRRWPGAVLVV